MSKFEAQITADAGEKTDALYESVYTDNVFYPENPAKASVSYEGALKMRVRSESLPHLRANINSILGLVCVCERTLALSETDRV